MILNKIPRATRSFLFALIFTVGLSTSLTITNISSATSAPAQVVVRSSLPAVDVPGWTYNGFYNDNQSTPTALTAPMFAGELVAFFSSLKQGTLVPVTDVGIWLTNQNGTNSRKLSRQGDPAPGFSQGVILHLASESGFSTGTNGRVSFLGGLSGPSIVPGHNSSSVWLADLTATNLVVQTGELAEVVDGEPEPWNTFYFRNLSLLKNSVQAGNPDVVFKSMAVYEPGGNSPSPIGIWVMDAIQGIKKLSRAHGRVPGISTNAWFESGGEIVSKSGNFAALASSIYGPAVTTVSVIQGTSQIDILTNQVLFRTSIEDGHELLARSGSQAPGTSDGVVFRTLPSWTPNTPLLPAIGSDGTVVFSGVLAGQGVSSANQTGLWKSTEQGVTLLARAWDLATEAGPNVRFDSIYANSSDNSLWVMDNGDTVFPTYFSGNNAGLNLNNFKGIYKITDNGNHQLVARAGVPTPALPTGVTLVRIMLPQVLRATGNDHVMFTSQLAGTGVTTSNDSVLMRHTNSTGLQLVAREGQQIGDFILKSFVSNGADLQLTDNYYSVVSATFSPASNPTASPQSGILGISPTGEPSVIAVRNSTLELSDGTSPNLLNFRLNPVNSVNTSGKVVFSAQFSSTPRDEAVLVSQIGNNSQPSCPADFNGNGSAEVADIFAFLSAWFAQDSFADFDGNGQIQVPDIFSFLNAWFAGC